MKQASEKTRLLFVFSCVSAVFFLAGLVITLSLPSASFIFNGLQKAVLDIAEINSVSSTFKKIGLFISSYFDEAKLFLFVFLACFTTHRSKFFICVCAFKGASSGIGCSLFLRTLPFFEVSGWHSFISSIVFVLTSVCSVILLILFCTKATLFSKKIIYPIKISSFLKRKDTKLFIFDLFAFCGLLIVIMFLKVGNLFSIIS